ncbi:MAG TPA: YwqG family protein [Candidatus Dormibacteraeota bacterium]|nr:YwqG family protein [Candidatus Dormibacteraeota bacterium]
MPPDDLQARLIAASPSAGRYIADSIRPALRLATWPIDEKNLKVGVSKYGGSADLPRGAGWPSWTNPQGKRRPMIFFAQVDLAEAARVAPAPMGLPESGLLSFFADYAVDGVDGILGLYSYEQQGVAIVHSPAGADLRRMKSPVKPQPSAALAMLPAWSWVHETPADVDLPDVEFDALDAFEHDYENELRRSAGQWHVNGRHQLGGHATFIQHPVEEEVVQALNGCYDGGKFDRDRWKAVAHQVKDWRLILQVDSDSGLDLMWGDAGMLYWEARREEAAAGRWDRPAFNFQCS